MPKRKPTLTIIGPGRLGTALAAALSRVGYSVHSLIGRKRSSLTQAAALLNVRVPTLVFREVEDLGDVVLIATPDDQLPSVAKTLSALKLNRRRPPDAIHTSGALSSEVLSPLRNRGWGTASVHPLVSVSDAATGAQALLNAYWCVEGSRSAVQQGRGIVQALHGNAFTIKTSAKPLYHAAAVMTSGNVVALFDTAIDMMECCGLKRDKARQILTPLLQSTAANLGSSSPAKALTGTFSRGDIATVERHLKALAGTDLQLALELYRLLGHKSLALAAANGLDQATIRRIARLLERNS